MVQVYQNQMLIQTKSNRMLLQTEIKTNGWKSNPKPNTKVNIKNQNQNSTYGVCKLTHSKATLHLYTLEPNRFQLKMGEFAS